MNFHILTIAVGILCAVSAKSQQISTNITDWASTQSVLAHIEILISQNNTTASIAKCVSSNTCISADTLWTNCLDFTIVTNDYASGKRQIEIKEKVLLSISQMDSFSYNSQNRLAAELMIDQIDSKNCLNLGKPLPFPGMRLSHETFSTNDTPAEIERKIFMNSISESNYVARITAYKLDQDKRLFYKALRALKFYLTVYIRGVHDD